MRREAKESVADIFGGAEPRFPPNRRREAKDDAAEAKLQSSQRFRHQQRGASSIVFGRRFRSFDVTGGAAHRLMPSAPSSRGAAIGSTLTSRLATRHWRELHSDQALTRSDTPCDSVPMRYPSPPMPSAAAPAPNAVSSGLINNPTTRHGASAMSTTLSNLPSAFVVASDKPRDNGKGLPSTSTCHSTPTDFLTVAGHFVDDELQVEGQVQFLRNEGRVPLQRAGEGGLAAANGGLS